ncbi:MAG TPA: hypothetical protein VHV50_07280 [Actinomycetota bacterium]|nr:hypothetical protein [Actinomycetota bacterium]
MSRTRDRRVGERRADERRSIVRPRQDRRERGCRQADDLTGATLEEEFRLATWLGRMVGYEIVAAR